jgi:ketosteroid isomerase-like protein
VTGEARLDASLHGQDISGTDRYTRVLRREPDGVLRAVSQHGNAVAQTLQG